MGAKQTLTKMAELANTGSRDLLVRQLAIELSGKFLQKDYEAEACRCLSFCRDNIRYIRDIYSVEVLQYPRQTLEIGAGDCDDKAILCAALLASIGHRVRFVAIAFMPGHYSHVWLQTYLPRPGKWLDLEPTEPLSCGERVPHAPRATYLYREL